jgi:hypothetical protein
MRTLLLVGIAGIAALTADSAQANHGSETTRVERRVIVVDGASADDAAVYRNGDDRALAESDYRGRWQGEWNGSWDEDRERYRGTYEGEYRGRADDHDGRHRIRHDDRDLERLCRRDNGVGGAAIGAAVGGLAGNRIAGRGSRTEGTLIGAGVGAIAGLAIDRSEDRRACEDYWRRHDRGNAAYGNGDRDYSGYAYEGGSYYGGGVTTIVIPGQPVIIEETTTTYEDVAVAVPRARTAPRRVVHRRRAAPRPAARCICR